MSGIHPGGTKLYKLIQTRFYWPNLFWYVQKYAKRMQNVCKTYAKRMQNVCKTYANRMKTYAKRMQNVCKNVCKTYAKRMQKNVCKTYAKRMQNVCKSMEQYVKIVNNVNRVSTRPRLHYYRSANRNYRCNL